MARLNGEFLGRVERFCDRAAGVAETVQARGRSRRMVERMTGGGASVGADLFEADEAMSRSGFTRRARTAIEELNQTRFWVRMVGRRSWTRPARRSGPDAECVELGRILGAMVARTQRPSLPRQSAPPIRALLPC
jgi:four helix bundle protein